MNNTNNNNTQHSHGHSGTVKWFNPTKGFGFISTQDQDVFVHITAVHAAGMEELAEGQILQFDTEDTAKGPQAINLQSAE